MKLPKIVRSLQSVVHSKKIATNHELFTKNHKAGGFTLIELLVAISIIGILAAITIPQLTAFNRRQVLKNVASEVKNNLRYAQSKNFATEVDTSICNMPNVQVLRGWYFSIDSSSSYSISGLCANPNTGLTFGTRTFQLPQGLTISMSPATYYVLFEPLTRGISFYDPTTKSLAQIAQDTDSSDRWTGDIQVDIVLSFSSDTRRVTVTERGEMYDHQ